LSYVLSSDVVLEIEVLIYMSLKDKKIRLGLGLDKKVLRILRLFFLAITINVLTAVN